MKSSDFRLLMARAPINALLTGKIKIHKLFSSKNCNLTLFLILNTLQEGIHYIQ